ncbi:MAG: polysaccharide biosynthesis C-terminal domain-containing protein [Actinomycetota bacterium]
MCQGIHGSNIVWFFSFLSILSNNIIRPEKKPRAAMYPLVVGALTNIILDAVFIFVFGMGIRGVAVAAIISQIIVTIYLLFYFNFGKSIFHFRLAMSALKERTAFRIISIVLPSFLRAIISSFFF